MNLVLKIILLLFLPFFGLAQDSVLNISTKNYHLPSDGIRIGNKEGWVFHKAEENPVSNSQAWELGST